MNHTALLNSATVMMLLSACDAGYDAIKLAEPPKEDPRECWTPKEAHDAGREPDKEASKNSPAKTPVDAGSEPTEAPNAGEVDSGSPPSRESKAGSIAPVLSMPAAPVLLEVVEFSIRNAQGSLPLRHGDTAVGLATYRNPTDQSLQIKSILIKGRPQLEGAEFYDFTPVLNVTMGPRESATVEANRVMLPTDPIGLWLFHTNWQSADEQWHDGGALSVEVAMACTCEAGEACCDQQQCSDLLSDPQNCGACGNVCPVSDPACCNGTCQSLRSDTACGSCEMNCSAMSDLCTCVANPRTGVAACYWSVAREERCLR